MADEKVKNHVVVNDFFFPVPCESKMLSFKHRSTDAVELSQI